MQDSGYKIELPAFSSILYEVDTKEIKKAPGKNAEKPAGTAK
jgi:hypothetical protein